MSENCARCANEFDTNTSMDGAKATPVEGDISLCLYCGYITKFDTSGALVEMPLNELIVNCENLRMIMLLCEASRDRYAAWLQKNGGGNVH